MADFGCPSMAKRLALLLVLLSMELVEAKVEWSAWFGVTTCSRLCSRTHGSAKYGRKCYNCTDEAYPCKEVLLEYCEGRSVKTDVCYVATSCRGEGLYVGEWTEWSGQYGCPPAGEPCTGAVVQLVRECALPKALRDRWRPFRCPGRWATERRLACPCEASHWLDWSAWSACSGPCPTGHRTRRRRCLVVVASGVGCQGSGVEVGRCSVGCGYHQAHYRATREADDLGLAMPPFVLPTVFVIIMMLSAWAYVCWHTHKFIKTRKLKKDKDKDKDKDKKKGDEKDDKKGKKKGKK